MKTDMYKIIEFLTSWNSIVILNIILAIVMMFIDAFILSLFYFLLAFIATATQEILDEIKTIRIKNDE